MAKYSKQTRKSPIHSIWITWEHQRRSVVLAQEFGATFYELTSSTKRPCRYFILCLKTLQIIRSEKPDILYVQSPSIILSAVAACYKKIFKDFILVVDRHSNFFPISRLPLVDLLLQSLADFALRNADITIVTNDTLKKVVEHKNGLAIVLQDKLPNLIHKSNHNLDGRFTLVYPCSFSIDEPVIEVIEAASLIKNNDVQIYVTGNYAKSALLRKFIIPDNIHFLGYLSEQEYIDILNSADAVLALTIWDNTLLCCGYEAVSLQKPIILSDKIELRNYFSKGAITCDNSPNGISTAIEKMRAEYSRCSKDIALLRMELSDAWAVRFKKVENTVYQMVNKLQNPNDPNRISRKRIGLITRR